jgi:NAD(P)H-dependent flavin oxidoreductase YrpB (nitropropane dioxygenase family)
MGVMWPTTDLTRLLGCDVPIVQAPLGGGPGTPELTAAVGTAGGFGIVGGGYLDPDDLAEALARTGSLTDRPFGVNLFLAPPPRRTGSEAARAALALAGAEYLDHRASTQAAEVVVRFRLAGRRFECVCERQTLRIIDAGVCLTDERTGEKGDSRFTLESLPGVIQEAERSGRLVVFRHA